jgi:hypothetical protein
MSFTLENLVSDGDIEVIVRVDSALDVTGEEYDAYLEDLDESKLKLKDSLVPTRFLMRRQIGYKHILRVENSKAKYVDGEMTPQMGFITETVRAALKGIKYDDSVPAEKRIQIKLTGDGLVEDRLMSSFVQAGIVNDLFKARQNYLENVVKARGDLKKS